jgi:hypothetical protein
MRNGQTERARIEGGAGAGGLAHVGAAAHAPERGDLSGDVLRPCVGPSDDLDSHRTGIRLPVPDLRTPGQLRSVHNIEYYSSAARAWPWSGPRSGFRRLSAPRAGTVEHMPSFVAGVQRLVSCWYCIILTHLDSAVLGSPLRRTSQNFRTSANIAAGWVRTCCNCP